ncbi:hypothetical protein [Wenzhouxiangella marina]|uniref:Uncharacterized protein n=1 Tax=Wenzhouxiangella marina TaxID=1579979 RepID=A0A0K0XY28_9GAMM|nr:hypothetical protein [Wenzhouxiangella marina]AKS42521.1 hypothetical protein WM2015_2158 [Wenzhouxiangella marina]MBB6085702.1 hypothetical protein [Wenzhouxiangella marina]
MAENIGSREFRNRIVGKTIVGVVARPGRNGQPPVVLMLQFDDGEVVEFVSPRSDRLLKRSLSEQMPEAGTDPATFELAQLSLGDGGFSGLN